MKKKKISPPLLYIAAPSAPHGTADIIGTREGLQYLKQKIEKCLQDKSSVAFVCHSDGEGYDIYIQMWDEKNILKMEPDYRERRKQ